MSTIAARVAVSRRARLSSRAHPLVLLGLAPATAHMLDPSSATELLAAAPFAAAAIAYALLFTSLPRPVAAWSAFVAGALAVADGAIHIAHVSAASLEPGDAMGIATGLGGIALLAAAAATVLRPKPRRSLARRWGARGGAALATVLTLVFLVLPLFAAVYRVHKPSVPVHSSDLAVPHEDVTLVASDGVELDAWWIPSRNDRAVILVHGAGGNRNGGVESRALMLARHGYGVLLYDARRHDDFGWTWYRDIYGAIAFLEERGYSKIGALGLSTGGEAVLEAAGRDRRIDAVVSEGAQASTMTDARKVPWDAEKAVLLPSFAVTSTAYRVLTRTVPPEPLTKLVPRITPRPILLVSAGTGFEAKMNRVYRDVARGPVELWEMDDARSHEYERRVVGFFDSAL